FLSGMKVGRDATGTMANTLILAIAGSSFNMMILIYSYRVSFTQLINTDFVAIEVIRGIAGSLGIIIAVPCVAAITAVLLTRCNTVRLK
ncbi:MAG: YibE/F family protein, partial [Acutalibacteraceae bacterium]